MLATAGIASLIIGSIVMGTATTAQAGGHHGGSGQTFWFVCKYKVTPGEAESLQSGDNPIRVGASAINPQDPASVGPGDWFADNQGRSYVLVEDTGQEEPPVSQCPPPADGEDDEEETEDGTEVTLGVRFVSDCEPTNLWSVSNPSESAVTVASDGQSLEVPAGASATFVTASEVDAVSVTWGGPGTGFAAGTASATAGEDLDCATPSKPDAGVDVVVGVDVDCDTDTVTTTRTTTTTEYVWDEAAAQWRPGPAVEESQSRTRPARTGECVQDEVKGIAAEDDDRRPSGAPHADSGEPKAERLGLSGKPAAAGPSVPTAVDAGLGDHTTASVSVTGLLGPALLASGALMLLLARSMQTGRRGRDAPTA